MTGKGVRAPDRPHGGWPSPAEREAARASWKQARKWIPLFIVSMFGVQQVFFALTAYSRFRWGLWFEGFGSAFAVAMVIGLCVLGSVRWSMARRVAKVAAEPGVIAAAHVIVPVEEYAAASPWTPLYPLSSRPGLRCNLIVRVDGIELRPRASDMYRAWDQYRPAHHDPAAPSPGAIFWPTGWLRFERDRAHLDSTWPGRPALRFVPTEANPLHEAPYGGVFTVVLTWRLGGRVADLLVGAAPAQP